MLPILISALLIIFGSGCEHQARKGFKEGTLSREDSIPKGAVKITPDSDTFPPILHNTSEFEDPVPIEGPINTAGVEDSPFVTPDGKNLYFFFTPDANADPQQQLTDGVTGVWWSRKVNGVWQKPVQVKLGSDASIDGGVFILGDEMWFISVRAGNYGEIDVYTARFIDGQWKDVRNAGRQLNEEYDVGELHITPDGQVMYVDKRGDIFKLTRTSTGWSNPEPVDAVNTNKKENQPFLSPDAKELWFTCESRLGYPGPSVCRSKWTGSGWGPPEEVISNFSGEPAVDGEGNLYFVHFYYSSYLNKIEADIYIVRRKK